MTEPEPHTIGAWYVAFYNDARRHWWSWMCRDGFRHVAAFAYDAEAAVWLVYDVTLSRTVIRALSSSQMDAWVDALPANHRIVRFEAAAQPRPPGLRVGFWCAPAVAHVVGVASRALRPEALYRDLLAQGARPAFESNPA
jgi:hypothetical protein